MALLTTWDNIKTVALGFDLSKLENGPGKDLILNDVSSQVSSNIFGSKTEQAQRYLGAHLAVMACGIIKVYDKKNPLELTPFGLEFLRIKRACNVPFKIVTP